MKRKTSKILFFICLAVFLIGIILLAMPFDFENYSYSNSPSSTLNVHDKHGFKFSVNIKNYTDEELENVKVEVRYSYNLRAALGEVIIGSGEEVILKVYRNGEIVTLKAVF